MDRMKKHPMEDLGIDVVFFHEVHEIVCGKMINHQPDQKDDDADPQKVDRDEFPNQTDLGLEHSFLCELVSRPADCFNVTRFGRVLFDLLPKISDVHINRSIEDGHFTPRVDFF